VKRGAPIAHREALKPGLVGVAVKKNPEAFHRLELNFMCDRFRVDQDAVAIENDGVHQDQPSAASRPPSSAISLPVVWSTTRIERRTLPRSSKPKSFTNTLSPSFTTSPVFATFLRASCEMCTSPSRAPKKFTNAPKSMTLTTLPS